MRSNDKSHLLFYFILFDSSTALTLIQVCSKQRGQDENSSHGTNSLLITKSMKRHLIELASITSSFPPGRMEDIQADSTVPERHPQEEPRMSSLRGFQHGRWVARSSLKSPAPRNCFRCFYHSPAFLSLLFCSRHSLESSLLKSCSQASSCQKQAIINK